MEILQEIQMHTLSKLQNFLVSFIASKKFPKFLRRNFHWKFPPVFNFQSKEKKKMINIDCIGGETRLWYCCVITHNS